MAVWQGMGLLKCVVGLKVNCLTQEHFKKSSQALTVNAEINLWLMLFVPCLPTVVKLKMTRVQYRLSITQKLKTLGLKVSKKSQNVRTASAIRRYTTTKRSKLI